MLDLLDSFNLETRQPQAASERRFVEERLGQAKDELLDAEDRLLTFLNQNREFQNSSQLSFEHDRLLREVRLRQDVVTSLTESHEQARIEEVRNTPVITIVQAPELPALPTDEGWWRGASSLRCWEGCSGC